MYSFTHSSVAIKLTRNTHNFFHILYIMQIYRARTKQKLNKISGLISFLNSLCAINCPIFASIFALWQCGDTVFRLDCYTTSVLCVAGSLGRRVPYLRKTWPFLIQRRQFNFRLCKRLGIEMQFAQVERGPTPLSTCKFTLVKIDNSFFRIRTTLNDRKISKNARHGSLFLLNGHFTKKQKIVFNKQNLPESQFLFNFVAQCVTCRSREYWRNTLTSHNASHNSAQLLPEVQSSRKFAEKAAFRRYLLPI